MNPRARRRDCGALCQIWLFLAGLVWGVVLTLTLTPAPK
jgi:hypothetical protein